MKTFLQLCKKYLLETEFKIEPYSYVDYFLHKKIVAGKRLTFI